MKNKKKVAAVACSLAAVMGLGALSGCADLKTTDPLKDMQQVIAEVNISTSAAFADEFAGFEDVIGTTSVSKSEMVASFIGSGYSAMNNYGWSYADTFKAICDTLVDRQIYIQYAKVYFLKNGWTDEEGNQTTYTLEAYNAAIAAAAEAAEAAGASASAVQNAKDVASIEYFLTTEEKDEAEYGLRRMFNNSLDTLEEDIIKEKEDDTEYETSVRTTPTGVGSNDEEYYDVAYRVYTGTGAQASVQGSYETVEGSTPTTRQRAYARFLANLRTNDLLEKGEDTSDITKLSYYGIEKKSLFESALITKLSDTYTDDATAAISETYAGESFNKTLATQMRTYAKDSATLESDLDSMSDTKFVLTTTGKNDRNYGFVINILLPFSTSQSQVLTDADQDYQDNKGNKFALRASLLKNVKATDQRGSWFTGEEDYSFDAAEDAAAYKGGDDTRKWLFFEDHLTGEENSQYVQVKNYYGKYTYNGIYNSEERIYVPNKLTIDGFLDEMTGYLQQVLGTSAFAAPVPTADYYTNKNFYKADGTVDYAKFVYAQGKIDWANVTEGEGDSFNANKMFVKGSKENKALSVINELSFAYNTDTAGLNTYLGYAVTANKTQFVSEFEYAAQWAVQNGAGSYCVVPSDYGWHIIYCTFSFADTAAEADSPFAFEWADRETEGSFSNLYYEALKANAFTSYSDNRRSSVINAYLDGSKVYEERYADLSNMGQ